MRRSREQDDDPFPSLKLPGEPLTGSGAVGIWEHSGACDHVRLLRIVRCHFPAAVCEALFQFREEFIVAMKGDTERFGDRLTRQVVFRGTEPTAEYQDVRTKESVLSGRDQVTKIISDNALEDYVDAEQIELLGQIKRVGIDAMGSEHLRS